VSEETQAAIVAKMEKLTRFFDRISAIEVTIDLEHPEAPTVDLKVSVKHKRDFVATQQSDNLMAAIDTVAEKMEQQLRKYKQKVQTRHRGSGHRQQKTHNEPEPDNL
jgi:putative sigma-54 modulation protein